MLWACCSVPSDNQPTNCNIMHVLCFRISWGGGGGDIYPPLFLLPCLKKISIHGLNRELTFELTNGIKITKLLAISASKYTVIFTNIYVFV